MPNITTQREVYEGLLADIKSGISAVHDDYIFITPVPLFVQADERIIQLIPGVPNVTTEDVGLGLVEEDFRVVVWARVFLDQQGHSTERITDATYGVMKTMELLRQVLIQSTANTASTIPVRWISGSTPQETPEAPGWVYYEDTYRVGYEITWS